MILGFAMLDQFNIKDQNYTILIVLGFVRFENNLPRNCNGLKI